jgi:ABC-2 type transport system ATP-binding protein
MNGSPVVEVSHLRKAYGLVVAVEDISFQVSAGEIFAMVGPNGAGKTTTVECVEGLRVPDSGTIRVLGLDPRKDRYALRSRAGMQLQESGLQMNIKVWEACDLFSSFYLRTVDWNELLERLGLADKRDSTFRKLSGGQKQRLHVALALLSDPEVVFLDEITTGLDPQARRAIWDLILEMRGRGKTVVLTTHYMEEAERLSDRVAVIDAGKVVALDTPENLVRDLEAEERIAFVVVGPPGTFRPGLVSEVPGVSRVTEDGDRVSVYGRGEQLVVGVVEALSRARVPFTDLRPERPSLEDVFLARTGKRIRSEEEGR